MINEPKILQQLHDSRQREQAFTLVVREYQEPLYWQIRRMVLCHEDANDVLQNTFLKAWSSLDTFRGESKLSTWLFRIAVNESLNHLEKQKKSVRFDVDEDGAANLLQSDPYFDGDETQLQLQEAIGTLPEKQRIVFNLKYFQEMKYEDMSQVLGTSVGALKASYHHKEKKITSFFEKLD